MFGFNRNLSSVLRIVSVAAAWGSMASCKSTVAVPEPCGYAIVTVDPMGTLTLRPNQEIDVLGIADCLPGFRQVAWSSNRPAVATVRATSDTTATIRGIAVGTASIDVHSSFRPYSRQVLIVNVESR